jgi:hypothetical protein
VTIVMGVVDSDTPLGDLTYSGTATGCAGMITSNPGVLQCFEAGAMVATITVTDPQGNSSSQTFTMNPCVDGIQQF